METIAGAPANTNDLPEEAAASIIRSRRGRVNGADARSAQVETAPREDGLNYRAMLEAIGVAVYTTDAGGRITFYNEAAAELWGRRPTVGKDLWCGSWRIYHLDGVTVMPHDECPMAICLKENRVVRGIEAIAERPDGSRVYFRPFPTPLHDSFGNLIGGINVLVDVTSAKEAELAVLRLAEIVESSDDAIISMNLDGIITSWNPGAERIFGYRGDEVIGRSIRLVIPPDRQHEEDEVLGRIRRGEYVEHFHTQRRRKDGSEIDISLSVSPIRSRSGEIVGASKIARDISQIKRAEEAAQRATEKSIAMKDQFLGLVSHELRTPITTILGNALLLERRNDKLPDESKKQALRDVSEQAERLRRIIDNLLLLTRVEADEQVEAEPQRLQPLLAAVIDQFEKRYSQRSIEVTFDKEIPIVECQPSLTTLAIENLITNAHKYSPIESPIEVHVSTSGDGLVKIRVRDYGIGLEENELDQLFTPFYRSQRARAQAKGIGLGLAVCKRVMEAQGGRIHAEARPEGGCDFILSLRPCKDEAP